MKTRFVLSFLLALPLLWLLLTLGQPAAAGVGGGADVTPLPPVTQPDGRMGVCYAFYEYPYGSGQRPYLDLMLDAGARYDRWDFRWSKIQANGQDQWDWAGEEELVRHEKSLGVETLGILLWTPRWASTYDGSLRLWGRASLAPHALGRSSLQAYAHAPNGPDPWHSYPPQDLDHPVFVEGAINPANPWGYFVYHLTQHFGDDPELAVTHWEVWNEPEWRYFWSGSSDQYCRLLQVAYLAIKGDGQTQGANPEATVLFGGLHYWEDPDFYKQVLDCLAAADPGGAAHNHFFDAMSVHFYSRSDNTCDEIVKIKGEMAARGMTQPIWLTETGAPLWLDPTEPADNYLTEAEAAAYVIQSYANALAAGVERYIFFRAHDADMSESFGLIRNDLSLRPAYVAYQVAARYLQGENQATRPFSRDVGRVNLWGTPRGKISLVWNRTPDPVTYTLSAAMPSATLVDRWGLTRTLTATQGVYSLTLPAATANLGSDPDDYIVGGDPLILIETDLVSPTSALHPLPRVNQGAPVTLTWTASDTQSGVWYLQVQASPSPTGPWSILLDWPQTVGVSRTAFTGVHSQTYYLRARARDNVGNWELWPAGYEVSTTVDADTELHWGIDAFFGDADRDGIWDRPGTGSLVTGATEISLTQVSMRFVDQSQSVVTQTVGDGWHFTSTWLPGVYTFSAQITDVHGVAWSGDYVLALDGRVDPLYAPPEKTFGLLPTRRLYLPILFKEG